MAKTKDLAQVVAKWKRVTPGRTDDYLQGVENPREDWEQKTSAAEANYKAGVTKAATEGRFGRGVKKAGTAKWKEKTLTKGVDRWPAGIALADADYAAGMGPVLDVINRTDIGPEYPTGDPRNIDRVRKIAAALHKMKTG